MIKLKTDEEYKKIDEEELMKDIYEKELTKNIFRYQFVYENFLQGVEKKKILEIGVGVRGVIQFLQNDNEVIGSELSQSAIDINNKRKLKTIKIDLNNEKFPFEDNEFDIIIFIGTIEHLYNPQNVINEIKRLIKKDGRIIISIPNPLSGHYQIYPGLYTYKHFKEYLKINNFKIIKFDTYGLRLPFYQTLMKSKKINKKVNNQTKNFGLGEWVYKMTNIFKKMPKRFGWSWVFEIKWLGDNKAYENFIEEFSSIY